MEFVTLSKSARSGGDWSKIFDIAWRTFSTDQLFAPFWKAPGIVCRPHLPIEMKPGSSSSLRFSLTKSKNLKFTLIPSAGTCITFYIFSFEQLWLQCFKTLLAEDFPMKDEDKYLMVIWLQVSPQYLTIKSIFPFWVIRLKHSSKEMAINNELSNSFTNPFTDGNTERGHSKSNTDI